MNQQASPQPSKSRPPERTDWSAEGRIEVMGDGSSISRCDQDGSRIRLFFVFFGAATIYLFLIFSSAVFIPFAHHNDANLWTYDQEHCNFYGHEHLIRLGRFIGAYLLSFHLSLLDDDLFHLAISRCVAIASVGALAGWFSSILCTLRFKKAGAFFLSVAVFTLPGVQLYILWITNFVPGIVTLFFALTSSAFADQIATGRGGQMWSRSRRNALCFASALVLLLAGLYTYPPTAMFFLVPTLAMVLFRDFGVWQETRLQVRRNVFILCMALFLYFVTHRFLAPLIYPSIATSEIESSHQFRMTGEIGAKLLWFVRDYSNVSLNLWNIYTNSYVSIGVAVFIICGLSVAFWQYYVCAMRRQKCVVEIIEVAGAIILLLLLSNTPILAAKGSFVAFRMIFPYSAMFLLLIARGVMGLSSILHANTSTRISGTICFGLMIGGGLYAQYNSTSTALNDNIELNFIRSQIIQKAGPEDRSVSVFVKMLDSDYSFLNLKIFPAEFNSCATQKIFIPGIVNLVLSQLDLKPGRIVGVNPSDQETVFYKDAGDIIINMNELLRVSVKNPEDVGYVDCSADSPNTGSFTARNAFDGRTNTFWETGGPFPHWIMTDFGAQPKAVRGYTLQTGRHGKDGTDSTGRMPKDWRFEGSNDGRYWLLIDTQKNQTNWKTSEIRRYSCTNSSSFRYYRLYISAGVNANILRLYEITLTTQTDPNFVEPKADTLPDGVGAAIPDAGTSRAAGDTAGRVEAESFTLIVLPDTQYYTLNYPQIFTSQTQWIKDNKEAMNIVFVLHEGDITNDNTDVEWQRANTSMSILDGVVPYTLCAGNHDVPNLGRPPADPRDNAKLNQYFPVGRFENEPWWGACDPNNPDGRYVFFDAGEMEFMIVSLEFRPNDAMLQWANRVVSQFPDKRVIFLTHSYVHEDDTRVGPGDQWGCWDADGNDCDGNDGEQMWEKFVKLHENIFLVLSGHILGDGLGRLTSTGVNGNLVHQILANYQDPPIPSGNGGNGWLRIMKFVPRENRIEVRTYSPWLDKSAADEQNQFDLAYPEPYSVKIIEELK